MNEFCYFDPYYHDMIRGHVAADGTVYVDGILLNDVRKDSLQRARELSEFANCEFQSKKTASDS